MCDAKYIQGSKKLQMYTMEGAPKCVYTYSAVQNRAGKRARELPYHMNASYCRCQNKYCSHAMCTFVLNGD